jgi:peptidoglycan/xylan/chitin deacetylase (PgdA/CDA1 family)
MKGPSLPQALALRTLAAATSRGGRDASLAILIFHKVLAEPDPLFPDEPDLAAFSAQMDLLAQVFRPLPLVDAVRRLRAGTLPRRAVCVTFDDGYANNLECAWPILAAHGIPATVFVAPGYLGDGQMFNDRIIESIRRAPTTLDLTDLDLGTYCLADLKARRQAIVDLIGRTKYLRPDLRRDLADAIARRVGNPAPSHRMMTEEQVRVLHQNGVEIGAHTVSHPILAQVPPDVASREIRDSKRQLQDIIGAEVRSFAFPNGKPGRDYSAVHVGLAQDAGFELALSTAWGTATARSDPYQLPRLAPWDRTAFGFAARVIKGYAQRETSVAPG